MASGRLSIYVHMYIHTNTRASQNLCRSTLKHVFRCTTLNISGYYSISFESYPFEYVGIFFFLLNMLVYTNVCMYVYKYMNIYIILEILLMTMLVL